MLKKRTGVDLLQALTSGALVCGLDGRIVYANPALGRLIGAAAEQLAGNVFTEIVQPPVKVDCALCLGLQSGDISEVHSGFLKVFTQNGAVEELKVKIKHSRLGEEGVLSLIDPFSEDTILTQAHTDFVSTVSHEFRTPLTSIKGFADTLLHYGAQLPDEEKRRFITIIKDQADRLIRLVENLLAASRLGASRMDLSYRPIPLKKLLEKVAQSIQAKALSKTKVQRVFELSVNPESIELWADADKLEQVFINLMDNAAKYSPADKPVSVKAEYLPEDDGLVRVVVQDQGAGIPADLLPRIFTQFYRVENPLKQEVEGTGLGLYIAKSITGAMGGQIWAESTPGKGSAFTVVFPAATPERQAVHRHRLHAPEDEG
ncbi:ATP-binding protein [Vampirovibrio sp.]|uniref:ATP-binding protein n=1 Tax=Vampirovibrio sp. TaxID=2717857 RepID=UPI003593DEF6